MQSSILPWPTVDYGTGLQQGSHDPTTRATDATDAANIPAAAAQTLSASISAWTMAMSML